MHPNNREGTIKLAKAFKKRYPNKDIWVWSGYLFDELKDIEGLSYIDTLVDGRFALEKGCSEGCCGLLLIHRIVRYKIFSTIG